MLKSSEKFKANVTLEKNIENIERGYKITQDLLIAEEANNIILYNLKLKKKILNIPFGNGRITNIHICKKPLYIDNKSITFSNDSFYFLTSSLDKKFALHHISYNKLTPKNSKYKLIAQCQPTKDELNGVIQIENGQILIATRDQHIILFSNKIKNGNFEKLFEVKKYWPLEAASIFEIRKNIIGVFWERDDEEADDCFTQERFYKNHSNDGLYIYSVNNNKIIEKKALKFIAKSFTGLIRAAKQKYSHIVMNDKLILKKNNEIDVYNSNNYTPLFKFKFDFGLFNIYPFNEKYFCIFYKEGNNAKIKLYNVNSFKNDQNFEFFGKKYNSNLFPISNNEYLLDDVIITIS